MTPEPAANEKVGAEVELAKKRERDGRNQSDVWSKRLSELLMKGWRMLEESCPVTGEVPLMQHPRTGRKWSVAVEKYTDEIQKQAAVAATTRRGLPWEKFRHGFPWGASPFLARSCVFKAAEAQGPSSRVHGHPPVSIWRQTQKDREMNFENLFYYCGSD